MCLKSRIFGYAMRQARREAFREMDRMMRRDRRGKVDWQVGPRSPLVTILVVWPLCAAVAYIIIAGVQILLGISK